jgi:hypothetical protein
MADLFMIAAPRGDSITTKTPETRLSLPSKDRTRLRNRETRYRPIRDAGCKMGVTKGFDGTEIRGLYCGAWEEESEGPWES